MGLHSEFGNKEDRYNLPRAEAGSKVELEDIPIENEIKVINLGSSEEFLKRVVEQGGELVHPRRLLKDTFFKLNEKRAVGEEVKFELQVSDFDDTDKLKQVVSLLGLKVLAESKEILSISRSAGVIPRRLARLRQDRDSTIFTVKERRSDTDPDSTIDSRREAEVGVINNAAVENLLLNLQYKYGDVREKFRTSYKLKNTLVELSEGPVAPPWAEIEGRSAEEIFKIAEQLGYKKDDLAKMSDSDYYRQHGVSEVMLNNLVFTTNS